MSYCLAGHLASHNTQQHNPLLLLQSPLAASAPCLPASPAVDTKFRRCRLRPVETSRDSGDSASNTWTCREAGGMTAPGPSRTFPDKQFLTGCTWPCSASWDSGECRSLVGVSENKLCSSGMPEALQGFSPTNIAN